MICPKNPSKDFDELNCRNCEWYLQCNKAWRDGNIWGKDEINNPIGDNLPSFIVNGVCKKDNQTFCNLGYACDACPYNKDKEPTPTQKMAINALAREIKEYGEEWVWNNINAIEFEKRLEYIEMFLSALNLLKTGEY